MKTINLLQRFGLGDLAANHLKIKSIKNSIVTIDEQRQDFKLPVYVKVYRVSKVPDYPNLDEVAQKAWDTKIKNMIKKLPTQVHMGYRTVNLTSKVHFWTIHRNMIEDMIKKTSILKDLEKSEDYIFKLFDKLEDFALENIYDEKILDMKREFYITVPYFNYEPFDGEFDQEKLNKLQNKIKGFCEEKDLKPYYEDYMKESKGLVHKYQQEILMNSFFKETEKMLEEELSEIHCLNDEELATMYNARYYHTVYTGINENLLYLRILDVIQIAGEFNREFRTLYDFFPPKQSKTRSHVEYNGKFYSIISIFRVSDFTKENQLSFISELEGDVEVHISYTPIEKDNLYHRQDQLVQNMNQILSKQYDEDEVDQDFVFETNKEQTIRDYIEKHDFFIFKGYILIGDKSIKNLNITTNQVLKRMKGFWAKRISAYDLESDLRSLSFIGVDCGKSGWVVDENLISYSLNFMHLDFNLPSAQSFIADQDKINEQMKLKNNIKKERRREE